MMYQKAKSLLILSVVLMLGAPVGAAPAVKYVTDVLYVPIRSGPSSSHKVLKNLKTGTHLTVLNGEEDNGYILVKTRDGLEGYMPYRYLLDEPVARDQLAAAQKDAEKSKEALVALRDEYQHKSKVVKDSKSELSELSSDKVELEKELAAIKAVSKDAVAIAKERDELKSQLAVLKKSHSELKSQNELLANDSQNEGIKLGITAILFGVFLGFVFPYLKPRPRRHSSIKLR